MKIGIRQGHSITPRRVSVSLQGWLQTSSQRSLCRNCSFYSCFSRLNPLCSLLWPPSSPQLTKINPKLSALGWV